jgi:diketogulonate reductase-like aldo/keto reductase
MNRITLPSEGAAPVIQPVTEPVTCPVLGLGTWRMGESARARASEIDAIVNALSLGYRLIDTAEMYGDGGAEEVVGAALPRSGVHRDELFIVSKVYPHNASRAGVQAACRRSLARLGLSHIDLYLLHWRGQEPLAETVAGFEALQRDGLIRHWGVSNFDVDDMQALWRVPGGDRCAANQVYYSLSTRGIEFDLLPWLRAHGVPVMAYSPIDQGALAAPGKLKALAQQQGLSCAQLALAWVLNQPDVIAIPKAGLAEHQRDNLAAAAVQLPQAVRAELDRLYPPPRIKRPLAMT